MTIGGEVDLEIAGQHVAAGDLVLVLLLTAVNPFVAGIARHALARLLAERTG